MASLLIPPPSASCYINIQASKSHLSAVKGYTSSYNSLKLPRAKQSSPKAGDWHFQTTHVVWNMSGSSSHGKEQKEISLSSSPPLSFMFLHSHSLQAYTLVPNASISKYQDITHSLWLFLGLLMKAEFVEFECTLNVRPLGNIQTWLGHRRTSCIC